MSQTKTQPQPTRKKARQVYDEDLFKSSTMTFGEHLEELRKCLFKAIVGIVVMFIVALPPLDLAGKAVDFIKGPLETALQEFYISRAVSKLEADLQELAGHGVKLPPLPLVHETIMEDRMLPSLLYFDPTTTVTDLRTRYPSPFEDVRFPAISPADILDASALCRSVEQQRQESGDNPGKRLWSRLPEKAQQIVQRHAKESDALPSDAEKNELAAALAHISQQADFYRPQDFKAIAEANIVASLALTKELQHQLQQQEKLEFVLAHKNEFSVPQFNRLLLNAAFPDAIAGGPRRAAMAPIVVWNPVQRDPRTTIKSLSAQEMFMIYVKAALIVGLVFSSPWVFYQIWTFVAAGLYPHEKRYVYVYGPMSLSLFLTGVLLAFFFVFQPVLNFLLYFNDLMDIDPDIRISEWFGFALLLPLGFGIAFQLPLVMLFLERIGIVTVSSYLAKWRVAILVIFVLSAVLTPADPYSMLLMAIPLTFLYFGGILLCKYFPKGRNPFHDLAEE
jgi:sec-independent protein translocase protein TatC